MYIYSLLTSLSEMVVGKKGICLSRNVLLFFLPRWFDSHFFFSAHLPGEVHYLRISILEESTFKHLWEVTVPEQQNKVFVSWIPTSNLSGIESFANHAACFAQHTPDGPEDNTWLIDVLIALLLVYTSSRSAAADMHFNLQWSCLLVCPMLFLLEGFAFDLTTYRIRSQEHARFFPVSN